MKVILISGVVVPRSMWYCPFCFVWMQLECVLLSGWVLPAHFAQLHVSLSSIVYAVLNKDVTHGASKSALTRCSESTYTCRKVLVRQSYCSVVGGRVVVCEYSADSAHNVYHPFCRFVFRIRDALLLGTVANRILLLFEPGRTVFHIRVRDSSTLRVCIC